MEKGHSVSLRLNTWVSLVETEVDNVSEPYFHLKVPDYVYVLAITAQGKVPLVEQYRPPLKRNSLELPAGLVENDQSPIDVAINELREETGIRQIGSVIQLPQMTLDSGRLENKTFGFIITNVEMPSESDSKSAELSTIWVTTEELISLAISGGIDHMGQIALILWAFQQGHLKFRSSGGDC
jgi:ADP-ribose pyrophosphatase